MYYLVITQSTGEIIRQPLNQEIKVSLSDVTDLQIVDETGNPIAADIQSCGDEVCAFLPNGIEITLSGSSEAKESEAVSLGLENEINEEDALVDFSGQLETAPQENFSLMNLSEASFQQEASAVQPQEFVRSQTTSTPTETEFQTADKFQQLVIEAEAPRQAVVRPVALVEQPVRQVIAEPVVKQEIRDADDDYAKVTENGSVDIDISANDGANSMIFQIAGQDIKPGQTIQLESGASLRMNEDGTVTYLAQDAYDLAAGEEVIETITYTYCDEFGNFLTAQIDVTICGEGDPIHPIVIDPTPVPEPVEVTPVTQVVALQEKFVGEIRPIEEREFLQVEEVALQREVKITEPVVETLEASRQKLAFTTEALEEKVYEQRDVATFDTTVDARSLLAEIESQELTSLENETSLQIRTKEGATLELDTAEAQVETATAEILQYRAEPLAASVEAVEAGAAAAVSLEEEVALAAVSPV